MSFWELIAQGIQDTTGHFVGRRDRDHAEHREDRQIAAANARQDSELQRRVRDARAAGLHPLAALGAQMGSQVVSAPAQLPNYPQYSRVNIPKLNAVDEANIKLLNKQSDFIDEQIADSKNARFIRNLSSGNDKTRLPGGDLPSVDPQFTAQAAEDKYGEISDLDGGLMRFMDALKQTYRVFDENVRTYFTKEEKSALNKLFNKSDIKIQGAK